MLDGILLWVRVIGCLEDLSWNKSKGSPKMKFFFGCFFLVFRPEMSLFLPVNGSKRVYGKGLRLGKNYKTGLNCYYILE